MSRLTATTLSLLALSLPVLAADAADPVEALKNGKTTLELRTRYEHVEDENTKKTADAPTNRLVLTYTSGSWKGISLTTQFENITVFGDPRFQNKPEFTTVPYGFATPIYGNPAHAVVNDAPGSQVNQIYLEFEGLKVGRQVLNLDNQRFIGSVGWRQNDQSFTGATFTNKTWIPYTEFTLGHLTRAHRITGETRDIRAELANVHFTFIPQGHLRAFYYAFDEKMVPATSFSHLGARVDGEVWKVLYDFSFANQKAYKDATPLSVKEVGYHSYGLGFKFSADHSLMATQETLEGGFKTPYATLHAYNGWADKFLNTPANGLVDEMLVYKGKIVGVVIEAAYHQYKAETDGTKYGKEVNLSVAYPFTKWLTGMVKVGNYTGDTANATAFGKDLKKFWLQTVMKF